MIENDTSDSGMLLKDDDRREKDYALGCEPTETVAPVPVI